MFLPNKYEHFAAALRNYIQNSILEKGLSIKHLIQLKKIFEFESVFLYNEKLPCDVNTYVSKLLVTIYSKLLEKNIHLNFIINIKYNYIINTKLFLCLILNVVSVSNNIKIYDLSGHIIIKAEAENKLNQTIVNAIGAKLFYERKTKTFLIAVKAQSTSKLPINTKNEWDLTDPLSPINLYLL